MAEKSVNSVTVELQGDLGFAATAESGGALLMDPEGPTPMETLLAALGGCAGMDMVSILRKKRQQVTGYSVQIHGTRAGSFPTVFTTITMHHTIMGNDISEEAVRRALELTETKYCPVLAMLRHAAPVISTYSILQTVPLE